MSQDAAKRKMVSHEKRLSGNAPWRRLQTVFKKQFKQGRTHQTIQQISATRGIMPPRGLPTDDNIVEINVRDIINCSPKFIST